MYDPFIEYVGAVKIIMFYNIAVSPCLFLFLIKHQGSNTGDPSEKGAFGIFLKIL